MVSFRNLDDMKKTFLLLLVVLQITACTKKPDPVGGGGTETFPAFKIEFSNQVDGKPLVFKEAYKTANGDTFKVSTFRYYISNIALINDAGGKYTETESYHLIDHAFDSTHWFTLKNIPEGTYTKIMFLIGVDSVRNISGAQTGALDVNNGMFWDWNTGYTMMKLEGETPNSDTKYLTYHTAGFKGEHNVLRWVTLTLPKAVKISKSETHTLHLTANVGEVFRTPYIISLKDFSLVTSTGAAAKKIADNYADMFSIDHIE
jgi:hypothetical protein